MPTMVPLKVESHLKWVCSREHKVNYPMEIVKNNSNKGEAVGGSQNASPDTVHKSS